MKIVDINGEPIDACMSFQYLGITISCSTIFGPRAEVAIFDEDNVVELDFERANSIPHAMELIDLHIAKRS